MSIVYDRRGLSRARVDSVDHLVVDHFDRIDRSESESELLLVSCPNDNHSPGPVIRDQSDDRYNERELFRVEALIVSIDCLSILYRSIRSTEAIQSTHRL